MGFTAKRSNKDRISNLPSSVIGYILSFLPTKDAVATSVLSTKWKDLWTLVTRLSIDDTLLLRPGNIKIIERLKAEFVEFVYRVLLMGRFSGIETFRLHCCQSDKSSSINAWLSCVLKSSNVQVLDLAGPLWNYVHVLPSNLFTCTTLVKLYLAGIFMSVPDSVCLPSLKLVGVLHVEFPDDDSITRLLSGCPALDGLKLKRCMGKNVRVITISVPSLTALSLEFLHHDSKAAGAILDGDVAKFRIVLDTPSLSLLFINDNVHNGYEFGNLDQLRRACFMLYCPLGQDLSSVVPFEEYHRSAVYDLLKGISKVQLLYAYTEGINRWELLPKYENLTELEFGAHWNVTLDLLHKLLERSPQLRCLRLKFHHEDDEIANFDKIDDEDGGSLEWDAPSRCVPHCLLFQLDCVEIENFRALNKEVELVKYILKNARVLEKLTILGRFEDGKRLKIFDSIERLPKASKFCQIKLS